MRVSRMFAIAILAAATTAAWGNPSTLVPTDGAAPDLFLLYTGDVIGYVEPCG